MLTETKGIFLASLAGIRSRENKLFVTTTTVTFWLASGITFMFLVTSTLFALKVKHCAGWLRFIMLGPETTSEPPCAAKQLEAELTTEVLEGLLITAATSVLGEALDTDKNMVLGKLSVLAAKVDLAEFKTTPPMGKTIPKSKTITNILFVNFDANFLKKLYLFLQDILYLPSIP